jgi:hypothetical protein
MQGMRDEATHPRAFRHLKGLRMRLITTLLATTVLLIEISAHGVHAQSSTSSGSSVKIASIAPELSKPLHVGERVRIAVEVEYVMTEDSGAITLVVQKGESGGFPLASSMEVVLKGKGTAKLEAEIEIPDTKAIQVFTPLSFQGGTSTSIVDYRVFKVTNR